MRSNTLTRVSNNPGAVHGGPPGGAVLIEDRLKFGIVLDLVPDQLVRHVESLLSWLLS